MLIQSEEVEMTRMQEVEICQIKDGGRFKLANYHGLGQGQFRFAGWTFGTKVYANVSRARVRLEGGQVHVVFGEGEHRREFDGNGRSEVNWPPQTEVVPVDEQEWLDMAQQSNPRQTASAKRSGGAAPMTDPKVLKAEQAKYNFQMKALNNAKETGDEAKVAAAQSRLDKIEVSAGEKGVTLAELTAIIPTAATPNTVTTITAKGSTVKAEPKPSLKQANADRKASLVAKKAAAPAKPVKVAKEKKADATADCLCGCGLETGGLFRPGHDAKVKGLLYKVERGELAFEELPVDVQPLVKMAGRKATAGKDDSDYRVVQSPVKFPGREDVKLVGRDGKVRS